MSVQPVWDVAVSSALLLVLFPALVVSPLIGKHRLQIGYMGTQHLEMEYRTLTCSIESMDMNNLYYIFFNIGMWAAWKLRLRAVNKNCKYFLFLLFLQLFLLFYV